MFDQEQHVCRLAAELVLATQALADTENARADTAHSAAALERSLVSLVEEVYALEFDLEPHATEQSFGEPGATLPESSIRALAAEFIASLVLNAADSPEAGSYPLSTSMLLGSKFDALSDALGRAGYLVR
jgi:hypothetical protein